jgi:hypothetical protein
MEKQSGVNVPAYATIRKKKVLIHLTTWMDFENITLNKRNREEATQHVTPLI